MRDSDGCCLKPLPSVCVGPPLGARSIALADRLAELIAWGDTAQGTDADLVDLGRYTSL
jgi:hypothetical protein